ncbi:hypothetical protein BC628DRAFT_1342399 [Trametes gibbosa]|nr:hypothetical protein BC628DRAFT_1342399 [Trametes gibbosa]
MNEHIEIPGLFLPQRLRLGSTNWPEYRHAYPTRDERTKAPNEWLKEEDLCKAIITLNVKDFPRYNIRAGPDYHASELNREDSRIAPHSAAIRARTPLLGAGPLDVSRPWAASRASHAEAPIHSTAADQEAASAGAQLVLSECSKAVDNYRDGSISKAQAIFAIASQLIAAETQVAGSVEDNTTIQSYLAMLDEVDQRRQPFPGPGGNIDGRSAGQAEGTEHARQNTGTPNPSRPPESHSSRSPSEEVEEPPAKRTKVNPASYAWAATEFLLETQLDPHVTRTIELIRVYGEDLTQARRHINSAASAPEFPESEWINVLTGRAVDLDHVFAGRYTPGTEEKLSEQIGELEVTYRAPVPSKKVVCFGDWVYAWKRASLATTFAFPHRREELDAYGEFIIGLFGALAPAVHSRVLDFNRAQMFTEPSPVREPGEPLREESGTAADARRKPADAITARTAPAAQTRPASVLTGTRAQDVEQLDTSVMNVRRLRVAHENAEQPRFLRGLVWDDGTPPTKCFAEVSLTHPPVPDVPRTVREDPVVISTLKTRPDLFKIVTPVNVERFEEYLSDHPNQEFVKSVVRSLREGFWPYADAKPATYPDTWDEKRPAPHDENAAQFLRTQRDEEISLDRYSASFGCELLPGMYSMPIHVVPKPHSNKLRLVNDQSAGSFSLNSMIRPEAIKGAVLDGIPALGDSLRAFRRAHTGALIMWKSDVSQAYRRMPVSPFWQIRQAVTIDGQRYIDRCNLFGGRGSLRVWAAFDCLVSWIAEHKAGVVYKHNYVDDDFGFAPLGDVRWYEPYRRYFPTPQARLLTLWDELGVPHEPHKQLHATCLPVIGFDVDPNAMSVTLPEEGRTRLLDAINGFCMLTPGNRRRSLAEFQAFTGYANWAFNVYPLLKPALSNIYDKMVGKSDRHAGVYINAAIVRDLQWFRAHIVASRGIHLLRANAWTPADLEPGALGDEFVLTDASSHGLGIYFPWLDLGFHCDLPLKAPTSAIFFFEALAVCAAIHRAGAWHKAGCFIKRLAVLSDNSNTVAVFNSLRASLPYNPILKSAVDIMLAHNIDVRVHHIAGKLNVIHQESSALDDVAEAADTDVGAVVLVAHKVVTVRSDVVAPVLTARVEEADEDAQASDADVGVEGLGEGEDKGEGEGAGEGESAGEGEGEGESAGKGEGEGEGEGESAGKGESKNKNESEREGLQ